MLTSASLHAPLLLGHRFGSTSFHSARSSYWLDDTNYVCPMRHLQTFGGTPNADYEVALPY
jgi:hypothetical protein